MAADGKVDAGELVGEFLGGAGSTIVAAPVQTAVYGGKKVAPKVPDAVKAVPGVAKAAAAKVKETAAKVVRPKSPEEVAAVKASKAPTEFQYKEKVEAAVEKGEVIGDENPIMAAEVAKKVNQKEDTPPCREDQEHRPCTKGV